MTQTRSPLNGSPKVWAIVGLIVIALLTTLIYSDTWSAPALSWDDDSNIFGNPYFKYGMWWGVWTEPYFGLYVPVTSSVWALLYTIGGGTAAPFHWFNFALHLANISLLFILLRGLARRLNLKVSLATILLATAVFAVHPLQVQAVAWVSGGRDLLAAFFALLVLLCYFASSSLTFYALASVLYILAVLSKPSVVVLPAVILLLDWTLESRPIRRSALRMLPWLLVSGTAMALTRMGQVGAFEDLAMWWQRPFLMMDSYVFYFEKTLWPFALSGNYAHTPVSVMSTPGWWLKGAAFTLASGGGAVWLASRDRRWLLALNWWIFLLPISGLVPFAYENIGGVADHYNYLPLAALAAVILLIGHQLSLRWWIIAAASPLVFGFALLSWQRVEVWQSDSSFFMDMARTSPQSYNTAIGMSLVMCQDVKDYDSGIEWTQKALAAHPNDVLALANQAFCYTRAGRLDKVLSLNEALGHLDFEVMRSKAPTAYSSLLASLASALIEARYYDQGFQYLCEAYRALPSNPNHGHNLEAALAILKAQGIHPFCQESFYRKFPTP